MDKAPDAFRTISEVAAELNVPQHVLRFWESRFHEIKPMKRGGGRRYYRPEDVELLRGIRHLLYGEGYTIRGVQRILKEQGLKFVQSAWQPGAPPLARPSDEADFSADEGEARDQEEGERGRGLFSLLPSLIGNANDVQEGEGEDDEEEDEEEEEDEDEDEEDSSESEEELRPLALRRTAQPVGGALRAAVSADDMRKLESALRELAECRRLLEAAVEEKV